MCLKINSKIFLRDVALNFSSTGKHNKGYEVTKSCGFLHPNRAMHDFSYSETLGVIVRSHKNFYENFLASGQKLEGFRGRKIFARR